MANAAAATNIWNCPNYVGEVYQVGGKKTPFLNMIGGLQGDNIKTVSDFEFTLAQPWALESASQPDISETDSLTAPTPTTYVRGKDSNTVQIYQEQVSISYAKQSVTGQIRVDEIGSLGYGHGDASAFNGAANEKDFQINANMRQISQDAEYTFLNGVYQQASAVSTAAKTRGIITACASNTVDASSSDLSKTLLDTLLREMADNGAEFLDTVIFVNALQKQRLSTIYGYAPEDRSVGGVNVEQIETDFAILGVAWAPNVPAGTLLIADLAFCSPVFLPVPDKGVLFYEELSKTGASEKGQIYAQMGLDYGPEEMHGTVTSLSTS